MAYLRCDVRWAQVGSLAQKRLRGYVRERGSLHPSTSRRLPKKVFSRKVNILAAMPASMPKRQNFSSGGSWEPLIGYSRAVRVGPHLWISGTTATAGKGGIVGVGDPAAQMRQALKNIQRALSDAGAQLEDVVRTRIFVTDMADWEEIGRVHGQFFGSIRPVATMVEMNRLISPEMLVEVEAEAYVPVRKDSAMLFPRLARGRTAARRQRRETRLPTPIHGGSD
jgi:enamine deaminase RidA (YjgF/YER057c/UK114 family)